MNEPDSRDLPAPADDDAESIVDPELLDSELQLVSSLAKLQKLEETVRHLFTVISSFSKSSWAADSPAPNAAP